MKKRSKKILAICAHNDDNVFGAGGTLAKYAKEGHTVKTVIFTYGELSPPHLKKEVIRDMRLKESLKADKILGAKGVLYFGLTEGKFKEEIDKRNIRSKLASIIKKERPSKIFTHDFNDPHPDHKAVNTIVNELIREKKIKCPVYTFGVWNLTIFWKKTDRPRLIVDITKTFRTKIRAIKAHKSQKIVLMQLLWSVYVKALISGWNNNFKYAEVFFRIN